MKTENTEPKVPADLRRVFAAAPKAEAQWSDLTPLARKDFIMWIEFGQTIGDTETPDREHPKQACLGKTAPLLFRNCAAQSAQSPCGHPESEESVEQAHIA